MLKYKYIFLNKIYGSNFNSNTRKLLWFKITKMLIAVIYYNFRHTFVPYGVEAQWGWGNEGGLLNLPNL